MAVVALIFATSCKKETTVVTDGENIIAVDENLVVDTEGLEAEYNAAVTKLEEAKANGDTEAQKIAQEAVNTAKSAWEVAKEKTNQAVNDVKEGVETAGEKIDEAADKTKADVKEATENAKEDAKKNINDALDKAKIK